MLVFKCFIEDFGDYGFIGYTEKIKGLVMHGKTLDETKEELWKALKIKVAYDYKLEFNDIKGEEISEEEYKKPKIVRKTETEFDFAFM